MFFTVAVHKDPKGLGIAYEVDGGVVLRLGGFGAGLSLSLGVLRESVWQLMVALILYSSPLAYFSS